MEKSAATFLFINVNHDVGFESSESIPISLGYILAHLNDRQFKGVILDDLQDRPLGPKNLEEWILRIRPHVIGFTAYQSTMDRIRYLCRYIKSRHRDIRVVLGGPQVIPMPYYALEELEDVDVLVHGEGELVMAEMARAIAAGAPLSSVAGITCKCEGGILNTGPGPTPPDNLDLYPSPYLSGLLNLEGKNTAIMLSSRGCSHVCLFCITPGICKGKVRYHSIERTIEEMRFLSQQGIERFWFADPNFTEDRDRTERLLEEKIRRGIGTPFWFQTRLDLVNSHLLALLKRAGADTVAFGLESGSPGVLAKTNKRIQLEEVREHVRTALSLGMEAELFTIFGLPGETVADAHRTLDFVRSLNVPIHSNSGSQQMQLYFGSAYEKKPGRFGFKPLEHYRPAYLSVGDEYETESMSGDQLRQVRNMWALANEQMEQDVYYKQRLFEVMDFLLQNRDHLLGEPAFYAYGALAASAIEEFDLLGQFLEGYAGLLGEDSPHLAELVSSLGFFSESDEPAGPMDRIIFDCRSTISGVPFMRISGKYWDVLLGRGLLLESFEQGFVGARSDEEISFDFVFPPDYMEEDLRGQEVQVHSRIRKVFKSIRVGSIGELKALSIRNRYEFPDLDLLRENNEILYYLALRDADPTALMKTPSHFLMLVHKWAKLGKREQVDRLAGMLNGNQAALDALAGTLLAAGKASWAFEYFGRGDKDGTASAVRKSRCLLAMEQPGDALGLIESVAESPDLAFQQTLLECLKRARPTSSRIPSLEHHVLNLRLRAALDSERTARFGPGTPAPVVHGSERWESRQPNGS